MKILTTTGLTELITLIKSAFVKVSDTITATSIDIDSAPTASSNNLVASGGVKTALDAKQDTISDLSTIRSGAGAGATALQPSALSSYRTASAQDTIDAGKASKASNPTAGHIATLDANGNPTDSGKTTADLVDIIYGYLYEGAFYEDSAHTTLITASTSKQYIDMTTPTAPKQYAYSGSAYVAMGGGDTSEIEEVTASGIVDLHETMLDWLNGRTGKGKMLFQKNIVNTLTSLDSLSPLSACMGNVLNGKFGEIEEVTASALCDIVKATVVIKNIAPPYSGASTYAVGAYCTEGGLLLKCTTAVTSPELFDSSKWTATTVMEEVMNLINQ